MGLGKTYSTKYLLDSNNSSGVAGQVLISTSTGVNWSDGSDITGGPYLPLSAGSTKPLTGALHFGDAFNYIEKNSSSDMLVVANRHITFSDVISGVVNERMRIEEGGNVGIGETSPDFRLDVSKGYTSGNGKVAKFRSGNDATFVNFDTVQVVQQDVPCLAIIETSTGTQSDEQKLTFAVGDNKAIIGSTSTVTNGMSFYTNRAVTTTGFTAQGNLTLHLSNAGNVGIGTTSPVNKQQNKYTSVAIASMTATSGTASTNWNRNAGLLIEDQNSSNGLALGVSGTANDRKSWIQSGHPGTAANSLGTISLNPLGGNVGIGTTSPSVNLDIEDSSNVIVDMNTTTANANTTIRLQESGAVKATIGYDGTNNGLILTTGGFTAGNGIFIDDSQNVGIGTSSPTARLDILTSSATGNNDIDRFVRFRADNGEQRFAFSVGRSGNNSALQMYDSSEVQKVNIASGGNSYFNGGNVGIGATSPSYRLTAYGSSADSEIVASFGSANDQNEYTAIGLSGFIASNGATKAGLALKRTSLYGTGELHFLNNNTTDNSDMTLSDSKMVILGNGDVGIGTTSPSAKLDVTGSYGDIIKAVSGSQSITTSFVAPSTGSGLNNIISTAGEFNIGTSDAQPFSLVTSSISRVSILSGGNVGIGTTSPSEKLEVVGNANITSTSGTTLKIEAKNPTAFNDPRIEFVTWNEASGASSGKIQLTSGAWNNNDMAFFTETNNSVTEKMRITSSGNVGIGTTNPQSKLHLATTGGSTLTIQNTTNSGNAALNFRDEGNNDQFQIYYALAANRSYNLVNGNGLTIYSSQSSSEIARFGNASSGYTDSYFTGNVGIGTTNPTNKLHIQGSQATVYSSTDTGGQASVGTTINNTNTAGNTNNFSQLLFTVGTNNNSVSRIVAIRSGSDASDLAFVGKSAAGVAEYMRIKSGGNVGIGTTSPSSSLEVLKSASSTTISEARISSLVTGGYGGQANLWLRTSVYGSAMLAFGPQVGSSTVASSASGKISYNTFNRIFTVTADSNALLTLGGSNDRVGINKTSPQYTLDVTGNGRFTSTVTATNFINSSDKRLKENIEEVCNNNVEVNWKTFNFKTEKQQKRYGVIAQELEKTNPEFVREDSQGFKSVAYIDLLIAKIAELEARIQKLENK